MSATRRRAVALRKVVSIVSCAAFAALVVASLTVLAPMRPAFADDQSRAVAACRTLVAQQIEGGAASNLGIDRVGGGGRRYKVWLATNAHDGEAVRRFQCVVTRSGTVKQVTALNADGAAGQAVVAVR